MKHIYGLYDCSIGEWFYIGCSRDPETRREQHARTHNNRPHLFVLLDGITQSGDGTYTPSDLERIYIDGALHLGHNLINKTLPKFVGLPVKKENMDWFNRERVYPRLGYPTKGPHKMPSIEAAILETMVATD